MFRDNDWWSSWSPHRRAKRNTCTSPVDCGTARLCSSIKPPLPYLCTAKGRKKGPLMSILGMQQQFCKFYWFHVVVVLTSVQDNDFILPQHVHPHVYNIAADWTYMTYLLQRYYPTSPETVQQKERRYFHVHSKRRSCNTPHELISLLKLRRLEAKKKNNRGPDINQCFGRNMMLAGNRQSAISLIRSGNRTGRINSHLQHVHALK